MNTNEARALLARLLRRIAPEVDLGAVADDADLLEATDLDSMDFLSLMTAVRDETGIEVPERDYPQVATIAGFAVYLESNLGSGSRSGGSSAAAAAASSADVRR